MSLIEELNESLTRANIPVSVAAYILGVTYGTMRRWNKSGVVPLRHMSRLRDTIKFFNRLQHYMPLPVKREELMYHGLVHLTECGKRDE